jgi:hypothetical protein
LWDEILGNDMRPYNHRAGILFHNKLSKNRVTTLVGDARCHGAFSFAADSTTFGDRSTGRTVPVPI